MVHSLTCFCGAVVSAEDAKQALAVHQNAVHGTAFEVIPVSAVGLLPALAAGTVPVTPVPLTPAPIAGLIPIRPGTTETGSTPAPTPTPKGDTPLTFTVYQDRKKNWRWHLTAKNGKVIADSGESYKNKAAALHGIDLVKAGAGDAPVEDATGQPIAPIAPAPTPAPPAAT